MTDVEDIGGKPPLGALFSTAASDNAEVVPPAAPRGPESMWTTQAPAEPDELADAPPDGEGPGASFSVGSEPGAAGWGVAGEQPHAPTPPPFEYGQVIDDGPFSAEPADRDDDVIDAGDLFDPTVDDPRDWNPSAGSGSVFSSGTPNAAPPGPDDSPWTMLPDEWPDRPGTTVGSADSSGRSAHSTGPATNATGRHEPAGSEPSTSHWTEYSVGSSVPHAGEAVSDPHGLEAAVARLPPQVQEHAAVAIAVCGALLEPDELVAGIVIGQMLGRPAAVTVTDRRVIIANDRRWQPLVDVYQINSKLVVRGRHDRQVAALSFADTTRLSMIDGITDVELAIQLAEHIRDTEPVD